MDDTDELHEKAYHPLLVLAILLAVVGTVLGTSLVSDLLVR
jgi:hypothetical protein